MTQMVKNPPAMQKTWVPSLGWEDALEDDMATHASIPAWRIPWTEEPGGLNSIFIHNKTLLSIYIKNIYFKNLISNIIF